MGWRPKAGGVTDHGELDGLSDDDHTQYLTETRHAALDADVHGSGDATDGQVLTADGAGGAAWEDVPSGGASELDDLDDVDTSGVVDGQVLKYDSDTQTWLPANDDTGSGSLPTPSAKGDIAVYDGSQWVVVSVGSDDQVLTADSGESAGVKWAAGGGGGGGGAVPAWATALAERSDTPHALDDEFDDDSLDEDWTEVLTTGSIDAMEGLGVLSLEGQSSSGDGNALVRSMGELSAPVTIETVMRLGFHAQWHYGGLVFCDGTDTTSNLVAMARDEGQSQMQYLSGTFTGMAETSAVALNGDIFIPWLYLRVIWVSANTWSAYYSIDGIRWLPVIEEVSRTVTPTHFGFLMSTWNASAPPAIGVFEYFRVYEADLSPT